MSTKAFSILFFQTLAEHLHETQPSRETPLDRHIQWCEDVVAVAKACQAVNCDFNEEAWMHRVTAGSYPSWKVLAEVSRLAR